MFSMQGIFQVGERCLRCLIEIWSFQKLIPTPFQHSHVEFFPSWRLTTSFVSGTIMFVEILYSFRRLADVNYDYSYSLLFNVYDTVS
jgi:hypothetical protein